MSFGTVPTKPCSQTRCRITDLMTHLWCISKAAVGSAGIFECQSTMTGHTGSVWSVCFDHTGEKLASAGGDGDHSVRLWSTESGAPIGSPLSGHSGYVTAVSYSYLFSNVWCVLTIEHFTAGLRVFPSVRTANMLLAAATTTA